MGCGFDGRSDRQKIAILSPPVGVDGSRCSFTDRAGASFSASKRTAIGGVASRSGFIGPVAPAVAAHPDPGGGLARPGRLPVRHGPGGPSRRGGFPSGRRCVSASPTFLRGHSVQAGRSPFGPAGLAFSRCNRPSGRRRVAGAVGTSAADALAPAARRHRRHPDRCRPPHSLGPQRRGVHGRSATSPAPRPPLAAPGHGRGAAPAS